MGDGLFQGVQGQVMGPGGTGAGRAELEASISLVILLREEERVTRGLSVPPPLLPTGIYLFAGAGEMSQ